MVTLRMHAKPARADGSGKGTRTHAHAGKSKKKGTMMRHNDTDNDNNKPLGRSDIRAHCILGEVSTEYRLVSGLFQIFGPFLDGVRQHPYVSSKTYCITSF
jgi:hypothetical protein